MKKNNNNIIDEWLAKHGKEDIANQVKKEIKEGVKSPLTIIKHVHLPQ